MKKIGCLNIYDGIGRGKEEQNMNEILSREVYLDNSATTKSYDEVIEYISWINQNVYGNPSSLHTKGMEAEKLIKKARESIANSLDTDNREIVFTSGGTEANNLAIFGYLKANPRKGKHIITTQIEHPSVLEVFKYLEKIGYKTDYISVDKNGIISLDELKERINDQTALVSIIFVNNEIGSIQPIKEISKTIKGINNDVILHVDGVQAYGKLNIDPKDLGIDLMTISSHKIHGPKGVGALYVKQGTKIEPIILGGGQESLIRSGTENVSGICGFGIASDIIHSKINNNWEKVLELRELFVKLLKESIKECRIILPPLYSPYILNVSFNNVKAEVLLHHLAEKGIFVSTGSACFSKKSKYSHVLQAMGIDLSNIEGAIRFSFSGENTQEDIIYTIDSLKEILPLINVKRFSK